MALKNNPGFIFSSAVHVTALLLLMFNFEHAPKFEDAQESVAVEMVTASELNQITEGEKHAKQLPTPQRRVDKVAEVKDIKPEPPIAEAKKDVPLPPTPEKRQPDPGQDDKPMPTPPQRVAELPPPPEKVTPPEPPKVEPEPPRRPPPPAPKAEDKPPPPPDAEALEPKPIPRPKKEVKTEPQNVPTPPEKRPPVKEVKEAKTEPEPPKKPEPHLKLDEVAKLLDKKDDKPVSKPKSGSEAKDQPSRRTFDPANISALLDHEAPQRKASTGQKLTQEASLGLPNAHAATLSPSMLDQLNQIMMDQYNACWNYFGLGNAHDYVPEVRVHLARDGSLLEKPILLNQPTDPNLRSLADSALRAAEKCNPMKIPERFAPYYEQWARRRVSFDQKNM